MHFTLSRGESIGLAFETEAGLSSAIAASVILALVFRRIYIYRLEAMDIYVIALFAAEVIQGLGQAISMKWVIEGEVNVGTFCTTQGVIQQLGETGVALATLSIAMQTFVTIWWLKDPKIPNAFIYVGIQWAFVLLFVIIGFAVNSRPPSKYYSTPTPYWCWIGQHFQAEEIAGEYAWFWVTLLVSIALYLPLFLLHLGVIEPGQSWYAPTPNQERGEVQVQSKALSRKPPKLWTAIVYPSVYFLVIMPLSIVRWIGFGQETTDGASHIPPVVTFIFAIPLSLSGVFNAILYLLTRTWLFWPEREADPEAPDPVAEPDNGYETSGSSE